MQSHMQERIQYLIYILIYKHINIQTYKHITMLTKLVKKCFSTSGALLTWGQTTYGWGRSLNNQYYTPGFVEGFTNVTQVATGPYHLSFLTSSDQVYSVGYGSHGRLGTGNDQTQQTPAKINIPNNSKVIQLAAGETHGLALLQSGQVLSWGSNGIRPSSSSPTVVPQLTDIKQISAGSKFSLAVSKSGNVYGWGSGLQYLYQKQISPLPIQLEQIKFFCERHHTTAKKILSVDKLAMVLFQNGKLYALGKNNGGVFATRQNPLIISDNHHYTLAQINHAPLHKQKIADFEISANSLIFTTDAGNIFYSGMHAKFLPTRFPSSVKAKSMFATYDSVGIIGEDGKVYFLNDAIVSDYDKVGQVMVSDQLNLKGVSKIGGSHKLRYALSS